MNSNIQIFDTIITLIEKMCEIAPTSQHKSKNRKKKMIAKLKIDSQYQYRL